MVTAGLPGLLMPLIQLSGARLAQDLPQLSPRLLNYPFARGLGCLPCSHSLSTAGQYGGSQAAKGRARRFRGAAKLTALAEGSVSERERPVLWRLNESCH